MKILQGMHIRCVVFTKGGDRLNQRLRSRHGRHAGHVVLQRSARIACSSKCDTRPSGVLMIRAISPRLIWSTMFGRPSFTLKTFSTSRPTSRSARPFQRGHDLETQAHKLPRQQSRLSFIDIVDTDERLSACRQRQTRAHHRLAIGLAKRFANAHHFAGRMHLRTQNRINAGKLRKRKDRRLDEKAIDRQFIRQVEISSTSVRPSPAPRSARSARR